MPFIRFNYADIKPISLKNKGLIKQQIADLFLQEKKVLQSLTYIFCSDNFLLEINKTYLHHSFFTDIITFDLSEETGIVGEIYISIDRVKENAATYSSGYSQELLRVIFHGALHLVGYTDKKKSEITIMRQKEDYYLQLFQKNK